MCTKSTAACSSRANIRLRVQACQSRRGRCRSPRRRMFGYEFVFSFYFGVLLSYHHLSYHHLSSVAVWGRAFIGSPGVWCRRKNLTWYKPRNACPTPEILSSLTAFTSPPTLPFTSSQQEGDKSLNNFECPGCAKRKGGQYTHGNIDIDALKERGVAVAAVAPAEATPQGDEEAGNDDVVSNACTWPPPEAEYFFGETYLGRL